MESSLLIFLKDLPSNFTDVVQTLQSLVNDYTSNKNTLAYTPSSTCIQTGSTVEVTFAEQALQSCICTLTGDVDTWIFDLATPTSNLGNFVNGQYGILLYNSSASSINIQPPDYSAGSPGFNTINNFGGNPFALAAGARAFVKMEWVNSVNPSGPTTQFVVFNVI